MHVDSSDHNLTGGAHGAGKPGFQFDLDARQVPMVSGYPGKGRPERSLVYFWYCLVPSDVGS